MDGRRCSNCNHYFKHYETPYRLALDAGGFICIPQGNRDRYHEYQTTSCCSKIDIDEFVCIPREERKLEACKQWAALSPDRSNEDNLCKICLDLEVFLDGIPLTIEDRVTADSIQARLEYKLRELGYASSGIKPCQN